MSGSYGEYIKKTRDEQGLTQEQLAERAIMTRAMVASIETGRRRPTGEDAQRLGRALGIEDVLTTFRPGQEGTVADYFKQALEFEQRATKIREFGLSVIPGLFQTEGYAKALIDTGYPRQNEEDRHKTVVTRLERGKVLEDPLTPEVWVLLDEPVLRRPVGGYGVIAQQLEHVADLAESGRVRAHVLPFSTTPHPLLTGMCSLMWFEDMPPIAYSEALQQGWIHDSPSMVEQLQGAYDLALSEARPLEESIAYIRAAAKEHRDHDSH